MICINCHGPNADAKGRMAQNLATMTGGLLVSEVNGPAVDAINSFERPDVVGVQERRREGGAATLEYDFPAHSLSVLRMQVR